MQSDKDTIDFFKDTVRGKYYSVYHYDGINDGNHQEYLFGICRIKPQIELQSGVKRIPFEITVLNNDSQLEYDEPDTGGSNAELPTDSYAQGDGGADAIWVLANQYYTITETPVT